MIYVILKSKENHYLFCSKIGWNNNQKHHKLYGDKIIHEFEASDYGDASAIFNYFINNIKIKTKQKSFLEI
jgi:hypothetical protein